MAQKTAMPITAQTKKTTPKNAKVRNYLKEFEAEKKKNVDLRNEINNYELKINNLRSEISVLNNKVELRDKINGNYVAKLEHKDTEISTLKEVIKLITKTIKK